jgi:hypothetical protein
MNREELARNPVLTEYDVIDLNETPKLPFEDNTFDFITNAVSVDYLTKPLEVFRWAPPRTLFLFQAQTYMQFSSP